MAGDNVEGPRPLAEVPFPMYVVPSLLRIVFVYAEAEKVQES